MGKGAIAIGIICIILGAWIIFKIFSSNTPLWVAVYPLILIILGIGLIIFFKEEEKVEQRKDIKKK